MDGFTYPGKILEEKMAECSMSRKELATRTGVTEKHICTVINGSRPISVSFARKLGYVFESTAYWAKLQAEYDDEQLRIQEENAITSEELAILKSLHEVMVYLAERNYICNDSSENSKVMQMRSFLNISDLTQIPKITYNATYRAQLSSNTRIEPYVLFAWQKLCEKETERIIVNGCFNKTMLSNVIPELKMIMFGNISEGIEEMQKLLGKCGIAFNVVRNFRGAPVQGFIKEVNSHRLILCLTIRRKRVDGFWFTLFHEIGHVLNGDYKNRFVDFDSIDSSIEAKADAFARDTLIDSEAYRIFIRNDCLSWSAIEHFAKDINVLPVIVLGRLQRDGVLDWSDYSDKVLKYDWA